MIASTPVFFLSIIFVIIFIKSLEINVKTRFFEFVPSIVIIYFVMMVFGNLKLFDQSMLASLSGFKNYILSVMIILMLSKSDFRALYHMKIRLIASFFAATITIMFAFVLMWFLFKSFFPPMAYKAFGALSGSWIGGSANMIAVASAIGADGDMLGFCLLSDTLNYAVWVMVLLALSGYKDRFNGWSNAKENFSDTTFDERKSTLLVNILALSVSFSLPFLLMFFADFLPHDGFMSGSFWLVVLSTAFGVGLSFTKVANASKSSNVGFWLLYLVISITACSASFSDFSKAPLYVFAGTFVIAVHAVLMVLYAKLTKTDLFCISVSSLANIGGVASAPILAASYSNSLVGVGVVMAMLGYMIGTFGGLVVSFILGTM